jgi:hypothetical protein
VSAVLSGIVWAARGLAFAALLASPARAAGDTTVRIVVASDEVRPRRGDTSVPGMVLPAEGGEVQLAALRGETVAFQVVLLAGQRPIGTAAVSFSEMVGGTVRPSVRVFRQHTLHIDRRSHNDRRPNESLGWRPAARSPDSEVMGEIPDALIPVEVDARALAPPPMVPAGQLGAFWVDVDVPEQAAPGRYRSEAEVVIDGGRVARFAVTVAVHAAQLPYRAASVFVFYETPRLEARIGDGAVVERQLWQLLHQHHIDALAPLAGAEDVQRLATVFDGWLFSAAAGYRGPGANLPPAVVALGAYGSLGDPTPESIARVEEMAGKLPAGIGDIFLYAVDEQCSSPRAAAWKHALSAPAAGPHVGRVRIGQTCGEPPDRQAADVVLMPASDLARRHVTAARAIGRRAWIYNGVLPHTGTMLLDADPRGLTANGWIAALADIERWFYWEATFWDDDNQGGRGPVDPFSTAENFHNRDGDTALGDGLLLYPGRQRGAFAGKSAGYPGVFPSVRLKAIRRGIQDAGYLALAAREHPAETSRLAAKLLPAILDEAGADQAASWSGSTHDFSQARADLRALIARSDPASAEDVRRALSDLATRRLTIAPARKPPSRLARGLFLAAASLVLAVGAVVLWWSRRRGNPARGRSSDIGR